MCVQELVSEKLQTRQMNNDLEKLTHELEKIGLNKERLLHDEQSSDDRSETHTQRSGGRPGSMGEDGVCANSLVSDLLVNLKG